MYNKEDRIFSIDWIQGVLPIREVDEVFSFFDSLMDETNRNNFVEFATGMHNFRRRFGLYGSGMIQVAYSPSEECEWLAEAENKKGINAGIFIIVSGDGLRLLGHKQFELYRFLHKNNFQCTRIDPALDIYDRDNLIVPCLIGAFAHSSSWKPGENTISTRMSRKTVKLHIHMDYSRDWNNHSTNIEIGKSGSELGRFKVYDKYLEVLSVPRLRKCAAELLKDVPDEYWYRLEYSLGKKHGVSLFNEFVESDFNIPSLFKWCVNNFFQVRIGKTKGYRLADLDMCHIWIDFEAWVSSLSEIQLDSIKISRNRGWVNLASSFNHYKNVRAMYSGYTLNLIFDKYLRQENFSLGVKDLIDKPRYKQFRQEFKTEHGISIEDLASMLDKMHIEIVFDTDEGELPINLFDSRRLPFEV